MNLKTIILGIVFVSGSVFAQGTTPSTGPSQGPNVDPRLLHEKGNGRTAGPRNPFNSDQATGTKSVCATQFCNATTLLSEVNKELTVQQKAVHGRMVADIVGIVTDRTIENYRQEIAQFLSNNYMLTFERTSKIFVSFYRGFITQKGVVIYLVRLKDDMLAPQANNSTTSSSAFPESLK